MKDLQLKFQSPSHGHDDVLQTPESDIVNWTTGLRSNEAGGIWK
jgi:hypothetical protein